MKVKCYLLVSMILMGIIYGIVYHYTVMSMIHSELVHCLVMSSMFGLFNYFIVYSIIKKYYSLKETNMLLSTKLDIDPLTTLLNRRAFNNDIEKIDLNVIYSTIFIDIDNFRQFNNNFGHQTGDEILRKVSQAIKSTVRSKDKVYRYGGEELVVLLKDCNKKYALNIAEKIRVSINQLDNSPFPGITISLGVATYPEDGNNISGVIEACDSALLTAKSQGKDCTVVYGKFKTNKVII